MRQLGLSLSIIYLVFTMSGLVTGGLFGSSSSTTAVVASATSSSSASTTPSVSTEVGFLQMLQQAQIASMDCLITLVNMTQNPIGDCLDLTSLATLVVNPSASNVSSDFATQLNTYLTTICAASQCSSTELSEASTQLSSSCSTGSTANTTLVQVLKAVLTNYATSYRTLACSVHL